MHNLFHFKSSSAPASLSIFLGTNNVWNLRNPRMQ